MATGKRSRKLNVYELAFVFGLGAPSLFLLLQTGVAKGQWHDIEFIVAFVCTALLFTQLVIRYLASASRYGCESSFMAWFLSTAVVVAGVVLILVIGDVRSWLLTLGVMLLLLAVKDRQIEFSVRAVPSFERDRARLRETATLEACVGALMLFLGALCAWGTRLSPLATPDASAFFGVMVAAFCVAGSFIAFASRVRPLMKDFQAHLERVG